MAETSADPQLQQQFPDHNSYATSNGGDGGKNAFMSSESIPTSFPPSPSNPVEPPGLTSSPPPEDAQSAMDAVKNSAAVQTIANGPVADKARAEAQTTKTEFSQLASSRATPTATTATGQNLTHYHSFFYNLLSWENPRATAISYVGLVCFIIATRYVPLVRYGLKALYMLLGVTAAAEIAGKMIFDQGFASKMRPRKYYTIPRETLESMMEDMTEFINFFVIELQRVIFAENVYATVGAFATALVTYFLIKITPAWGLALLFTTLTYFTPLLYIQNKDVIDNHLLSASDLINKQTQQVRDMASQHTNKAVEMSQSALKDYGARASGMVAGAKKSAVDQGIMSHETASKLPGATAAETTDFPTAPKTELPSVTHDGAADGVPSMPASEPLLA